MPKKGERATPAQRSALAAGAAKRKKAIAQDPTGDTGTKRWARLLDGSLTVEELTDEEVARMRTHGRGGVFEGQARRLPSHLVSKFHAEQIKRAKADLNKDLQKAAQALGKVLDDPEATNGDIIKAASILLDRGLGRTPETVHVKAVDRWADTLDEGAQVVDDRDLAALAGDGLGTTSDEEGTS